MNRFINTTVFAVAMAVAGSALNSCSLPDNHETDAPFTTCPVAEKPSLVCNGFNVMPTANADGNSVATSEYGNSVIFTENDICYFDVNTRELKFFGEMDSLYKEIGVLEGVEFHLGDKMLFSGSCTSVSLACSQIFDDIVLCYGDIDEDGNVHNSYYLLDCYPLWYADSDVVKANRAKHAGDWATFIEYLDSKGKLRK